MKVGVLQFPGSNDERDAAWAFGVLGVSAELIWHQSKDLLGADAIVVPGGFAYGDYLRCGAIARFAPVMEAVEAFADAGGLVLGICNGFQILTEAGLLPGALVRNEGLKFVARSVNCRVENAAVPHLSLAADGDILRMPVKHGEGRYVADPAMLKRMEEREQIVLRYVDDVGLLTPGANPNGATANIAGVCNELGNVMGLMPHPEHAVDPAVILRSMIDSFMRLGAAS